MEAVLAGLLFVDAHELAIGAEGADEDRRIRTRRRKLPEYGIHALVLDRGLGADVRRPDMEFLRGLAGAVLCHVLHRDLVAATGWRRSWRGGFAAGGKIRQRADAVGAVLAGVHDAGRSVRIDVDGHHDPRAGCLETVVVDLFELGLLAVEIDGTAFVRMDLDVARAGCIHRRKACHGRTGQGRRDTEGHPLFHLLIPFGWLRFGRMRTAPTSASWRA